MTDHKVPGRCPMGCGETLFLGNGNYITCSWEKCPNPGAVADLLLDCTEHRHIVQLVEYDFSIQHPIRERLNGELFDCPLHRYLNSLTGPPRKPGRYFVSEAGDGWTWYPSGAVVVSPEPPK